MTHHPETLAHGVVERWRANGLRAGDAGRSKKLADIAVHEVLEALRYNPAWAKALRIGQEES